MALPPPQTTFEKSPAAGFAFYPQVHHLQPDPPLSQLHRHGTGMAQGGQKLEDVPDWKNEKTPQTLKSAPLARLQSQNFRKTESGKTPSRFFVPQMRTAHVRIHASLPLVRRYRKQFSQNHHLSRCLRPL